MFKMPDVRCRIMINIYNNIDSMFFAVTREASAYLFSKFDQSGEMKGGIHYSKA